MSAAQNIEVIVLLGNVDHEGILSTIKTSQYLYQKKILESKRENWGTIVELLGSPNTAAAIVKLNAGAYNFLDDSRYEWIADQLLGALSKKRTMIFAYEALMDPDPSRHPTEDPRAISDEEDGDDDTDYFRTRRRHMPLQATKIAVNQRLQRYGLQAISYSSNAELTVMASQFLREVASNLLFRLYVPHGRLYASEMDKLLQLFKDYLDRTGRRGIALNKVDAEHGTSYEFCGHDEQEGSLANDFADFSEFMDLCVTDTTRAQSMLSLKAVDPRQVISIVDRYSKEARRLLLDVTHEREAKILGIRHRLESELTDLPGNNPSQLIRQLVDEAIPIQNDIATLREQLPKALGAQVGSLTVNINSQIIENARGVISKEITGEINLGASGTELLNFLREHGGTKSGELITDLQQIADNGIPSGLRLTKTQRLKSFCYGLAPDIAHAGIRLVEEYLKTKIH